MTETSEVVYLIGSPGSRTVKIGRTGNLKQRLATIQRMSPVPLQVLWTHPGGTLLETMLHRHFARLRSHGEWFDFPGDPVSAVQDAIETQSVTPTTAATRKRMSEAELREWTTRLKVAAAAHTQRRAELEQAISEASDAGLPHTDIAAHSPFSREWVRKIVRQAQRAA